MPVTPTAAALQNVVEVLMDARQLILKQRLDAYQFDEAGVVDGFCSRLARDNGWTREHASRVIDEYRKFMLLAVSLEHPVTPSDAVDQVWHLHLTDSSAYWDRFCPEVLGQPLHHHPSKGGSAARRKYTADYRATLESYRRVFGEVPPPDIWSDPKRRFGRDLYWQRVNLVDHCLLPRRTVVLSALGTALVLFIFGVSWMSRGEPHGGAFIWCGLAALWVAWISRPSVEAARRDAASRAQTAVAEKGAGASLAVSAGAVAAGLVISGEAAENSGESSGDSGDSGGGDGGGDGGGCGGCGGCGCGGCG